MRLSQGGSGQQMFDVVDNEVWQHGQKTQTKLDMLNKPDSPDLYPGIMNYCTLASTPDI